MPKKTDKKTLTVQLDKELYEFFTKYAEEERDSMAGIIRKHILDLKRASEQQ